MMTSRVKYARVKSSVLAPVSLDPVLQHMSAWHLRKHQSIVSNARPRERSHVNPGRKCPRRNSTINSQVFLPLPHERLAMPRSSSNWHAASHAKHAAPQGPPLFTPQILDTKAKPRLLQSRNYQPPRKTSRPLPTSFSKSIQQERRVEAKVWEVASSSSASSSGDSAYEAGGSSPPSRGSTPRPARRDSAEPSSPLEDEEPPVHPPSPELSSKVDVYVPEVMPQPLPRNEELDYAMFEHDLLNEILSCGLLTNAAVKQLCREHVATHSQRLDKDKLQTIVEQVQKGLDIPLDDSLDTSCFGLGSQRSAVICPVPATSPPDIALQDLSETQTVL